MKYCVLIIDGAADLPVPGRGNKTCLELAETPNLDAMARKGELGLARTIPEGIEPSSSNACMSVLGYDPNVYRVGRAAIEAKSLGISFNKEDSLFRCNLVSVVDGKMADYSAGHITTEEARQLITAINGALGNDTLHFYPGLAYRHIARMMGRQDVLQAECTPPHDISGKPVKEYLPKGPGSKFLLDLMKRSEKVLKEHPVNIARKARGELPATTIWLFWGSSLSTGMPSFKQTYGLDAVVTSAVDVIKGLAGMLGIDIIGIPGVTDGMDNNFTGQAEGALNALKKSDMVVIHVEATDEAGHEGSVDEKVKAIQITDREIIGRIIAWKREPLRVLVMPDHPTPIVIRTHNADPVPFMLWGEGIVSNGAKRFTEKEAVRTGLFLDPGFGIMSRLIDKKD
jgi:2,3-bisphosphoglycerate-independent phosphoglycerate mutase